MVKVAFNKSEVQQPVFQLFQQGMSVLLHHVKLNFRELIHQMRQHRGHQSVRDGKGGPEAQGRGVCLMHFPDNLFIQCGQTAAKLGQTLPPRGKNKPPPFLHEQLHVVGCFQRLDVLAYSGLGQMKQLGAAGCALALHQQQKGMELGIQHTITLPINIIYEFAINTNLILYEIGRIIKCGQRNVAM